jgi:hypothetical protein
MNFIKKHFITLACIATVVSTSIYASEKKTIEAWYSTTLSSEGLGEITCKVFDLTASRKSSKNDKTKRVAVEKAARSKIKSTPITGTINAIIHDKPGNNPPYKVTIRNVD